MWNLVINVDLNHVWFMCQRAIQVMRDKGHRRQDHQHRFDEFLLWRNYRAGIFCGKGAVTQLSKSIASDCADHSICCNVIAPGYMDTEMCANMSQERKDECTKRIAAGRWGQTRGLKRVPYCFWLPLPATI